MEAATCSYPATGEFLQCIYSVLVDTNDQKIRSMCLAHDFSFTDSQISFNETNHVYKAALLKRNSLWMISIYVDVASYCYYEKRPRTNPHSSRIFIPLQVQSWIILRARGMFLLSNFHRKRVIFEIAMMNIFINRIVGSLNNNNFHLNESSSLD